MVVLWIVLAAGGAGAPKTTATLPPESQRAYGAIAEIAKQTCEAPQANGWTVSGNAKAGATVDVNKFKQVLGSAKLAVDAGAYFARWSGPLQKDVGAALMSHNDCAEKIFVAMVEHLPLADMRTGRPFIRPSNPSQSFKAIIEQKPILDVDSNNTNGPGQQLNSESSSSNI
jgi:hypothetical protein